MKIKTKILATKEGTFLVVKYYNIMEGLWLELDYYQNFKIECSKDATMLQKFVEREMIFEFLIWLNVEFDQVWVSVLGKESSPILNEVFSIIWAEKGWRIVVLALGPQMAPLWFPQSWMIGIRKLIVRDWVVIEKVGRMNFPNHPTMMECGVHTIRNLAVWKRLVGNFMGILVGMVALRVSSHKVKHTWQMWKITLIRNQVSMVQKLGA